MARIVGVREVVQQPFRAMSLPGRTSRSFVLPSDQGYAVTTFGVGSGPRRRRAGLGAGEIPSGGPCLGHERECQAGLVCCETSTGFKECLPGSQCVKTDVCAFLGGTWVGYDENGQPICKVEWGAPEEPVSPSAAPSTAPSGAAAPSAVAARSGSTGRWLKAHAIEFAAVGLGALALTWLFLCG